MQLLNCTQRCQQHSNLAGFVGIDTLVLRLLVQLRLKLLKRVELSVYSWPNRTDGPSHCLKSSPEARTCFERKTRPVMQKKDPA